MADIDLNRPPFPPMVLDAIEGLANCLIQNCWRDKHGMPLYYYGEHGLTEFKQMDYLNAQTAGSDLE